MTEFCLYHDECKLPKLHVGDHELEPDVALVKQRETIDRLEEAIRSALDVTIGWDQIWRQGVVNVTFKDKLERISGILNAALEKEIG